MLGSRRCRLLVAASLTGASVVVPAAVAAGAARPTVVDVKIGMNGSRATGGNHLRAGWVTFHISANDGGYYFSLHQNLHSASAVARNHDELESKEVGLGGGYLQAKHGIYYTVQLPHGQIQMDFSPLELSAPPPRVLFEVGKGSTDANPGHADVTVTEGDRNRIDAPSSLPRAGRLKIVNRSKSKWHTLGLNRLVAGANRTDVMRTFSGNPPARNPFQGVSYTGLDPLAGNRTAYLTYRLSPGRYAFYDSFSDERTGRSHAADGAVTIVTVK